MRLHLGLVHHPVRNRRGDVVTTSVTNLDIHDIARSARTFGARGYHIITPLTAQAELVASILDHWRRDEQNERNPDRADALGLVELAASIEEARARVEAREGRAPVVAATGAGLAGHDGGPEALRGRLARDGSPCLLLLGTGWGLPPSVVEAADHRLAPILGAAPDGHNHLSVRAAAAIYLDRLSGGG